VAGSASTPPVGRAGSRVWRVVRTRCFAPEEGWTRHPQTGTVERQKAGSMFTQVNVHVISRLDQLGKMFVVGRDDWILRQIAFGVDR